MSVDGGTLRRAQADIDAFQRAVGARSRMWTLGGAVAEARMRGGDLHEKYLRALAVPGVKVSEEIAREARLPI